ncbi:GIY-YIG nuclease family protein [bacterium]|nr:GIY-YIG nuclease family protein [bacterium]
MRRKNGYWTKDRCADEALKHNTRTRFAKTPGSESAYNRALKNGWIDEICQHMIPMTNNGFKYVYALEFPEKQEAYIGLTNNPEARVIQHFMLDNNGKSVNENSAIKENINQGHNVIFIVLTGKIPCRRAKQAEGGFILKYQSDGWKKLNIAKAGSLGKDLFWTKERCIVEAKKCETMQEFTHNGNGAWNSVYKNGWLPEFHQYWKLKSKPQGHWQDKERCRIEAQKHNTQKAFRDNSVGAYNSTYSNGWMDEFRKYWNKENKN